MQSLLAGSGTHFLTGSGSSYLSGSGCFPMALRHGAPASKSFPMALRHGAAILFAMALTASNSATAPRPATNLIRRRKVLRFG